jgi:iron(III) transport system substrate-binding protein
MPVLSRRELLKASAALSFTAFAAPARAAAPAAETITPALIAAAKEEGVVVWYTSADLQLAELVGKAFEKKFGVTARVERAGGERIFARVAQEYAAGIHTVDAVSTGRKTTRSNGVIPGISGSRSSRLWPARALAVGWPPCAGQIAPI